MEKPHRSRKIHSVKPRWALEVQASDILEVRDKR